MFRADSKYQKIFKIGLPVAEIHIGGGMAAAAVYNGCEFGRRCPLVSKIWCGVSNDWKFCKDVRFLIYYFLFQ